MDVVANNDGSGEPNVIDVQLKTVVLKRPTSLQAAGALCSLTDSSRVSFLLLLHFFYVIIMLLLRHWQIQGERTGQLSSPISGELAACLA